MRKALLLLGAVASLALAQPAAAQRFGDIVDPEVPDELEQFFAYLALIGTPTGGLPDAVPPWMRGAERAGLGFRAAFGYVDVEGGSLKTFGGGVDIPFGKNDVGLTIAYFSPDCGDVDCDGNFSFGADYSRPLVTAPAGTSSQFTLGVRGEVGFSKPELIDESDLGTGVDDLELTAWSWALGAPLALNVPSGNIRFVPFLTPSLAWGQVSVSAEAGGFDASIDFDSTRFMLSGGIGIAGLADGLMVNASLKKVFVEDGDLMFGLGLSWNGVR
jgi:hypothetical protein